MTRDEYRMLRRLDGPIVFVVGVLAGLAARALSPRHAARVGPAPVVPAPVVRVPAGDGADLAAILSTPAPAPQPEVDPAVIRLGRGGSLTLTGGPALHVPPDRGGEVVLIGGPDLDLGQPPENPWATSTPGYMLIDVRLFRDLYVTADGLDGSRTWVGHAHGGVAWCSSASCAPADGGR